MASRDYFKGKRIAVIGLGHHGEMFTDVVYLIKAGSLVSVYDIKTESRLKPHISELRSLGLAAYNCGSIPEDDLLDMDLIILSHEYPRDSSFLKEVYATGSIPVEYPEFLFFKLAPPVNLVGVIGMAGKSTVISMLAPILERVCKHTGEGKLYCIDPESEGGILAHLKTIRGNDTVLMRITTPLHAELQELRISPHVAIFTSLPPRTSYTNSPFEILANQTYNNFVIASDDIIDTLRADTATPRAKMMRTKPSLVPTDWGFHGAGVHDRLNAALALQAARLLRAEDDWCRSVLSRWRPLKHRLELVRKLKGVEFYNDTLSTTPDAVLAGCIALSQSRNLILILGGSDAGHDYRYLLGQMPRYAHTLVLIPGSGTLRQRAIIRTLEGIAVVSVPTIEEAVRSAYERAQKGDRILFSPGFEAGGVEGSKLERGEKFVKVVKGM